jgi:glutamine amidotransferase
VTTIAVIDHGAGNLVSIGNGLRRCGASPVIASGPEDLIGADGIVLPGVGSAAAAMRRLGEAGLAQPLQEWEGPLLGICVGFQILFAHSEEGDTPCLGKLSGEVRRLQGHPLPHMGWNDISFERNDPLFAGISGGELFYFVHSYAPSADTGSAATAMAEYGGERFTAAARSGPVTGVQFHPERSSVAGHHILANFVAACREAIRAA